MFRIGSVSFLNARPLIEGLDHAPDVQLHLDVPSRLLGGLIDRRYDVALLPVIDYTRAENLVLIPAGGIGSDGPTLTVRIFSRVPIGQIQTLACDPDSHTSVALARIILSRRHHLHPEFVQLRPDGSGANEARLLIGDKVVREEPNDSPYQLDLGSEWKALSGLPFVFAAWMAHGDSDLASAYEILRKARDAGARNIDRIVQAHAFPLGWPVALARQYLTENLRFDIGPRELDAIRLFHQLAYEERIIDALRPLQVFASAG